MFNYFTDLLHTARLKARYRRRLHEQMVDLLEAEAPRSVPPDSGRWTPVGSSQSLPDDASRQDIRSRARQLVRHNPHARNVLRLLEAYVAGPGFRLSWLPVDGENPRSRETARTATRLWNEFLAASRRHFTFREFARRCWRDGEAFLRIFPGEQWPPPVRFLDPETIGPTADEPHSAGILTDPHDVEAPQTYLQVDTRSGQLLEAIPAEEILHTRLNVDSNQKRGLSLFAPLLGTLEAFEHWLETELHARKLQASIVLWRKVQGSPAQVAAAAGAAAAGASAGSSAGSSGQAVPRERYAPGTILTTSHSTELEYLQPDTNFADAVPLGRLLLLCTSAGAGLPEFMLTSDASNANFASTMVAEGPAVKLFQSEQELFAAEFTRLATCVLAQAVASRLLPDDFASLVQPEWSYPQLVSRDRPRERLADARLVESRILSRAEVARRDGTDPETMQAEIREEEDDTGRQPGTAPAARTAQ